MKFFTYNDYMDLINSQVKPKGRLEEEEEHYSYAKKQNKRKIMHKEKEELLAMLKEKEEFTKFLYDFLKLEKLNKEEVILEQNYFSKQEKEKPDLVYYQKKKQFFFVLQYEEQKNTHISYLMFWYCIHIMQRWRKEQKDQKKRTYPIIVPIVLYNGKEKWEQETDYRRTRKKYTTFQKYGAYFSYNVIDLKQYTQKELENMTSKCAKYLSENKYLQIKQ